VPDIRNGVLTASTKTIFFPVLSTTDFLDSLGAHTVFVVAMYLADPEKEFRLTTRQDNY